jgi:hypothetical protein
MKRDIHRNAPPFASVGPMNLPSDPRRISGFTPPYPSYPRQKLLPFADADPMRAIGLGQWRPEVRPAFRLLLDGAYVTPNMPMTECSRDISIGDAGDVSTGDLRDVRRKIHLIDAAEGSRKRKIPGI